MEISLSAQNAKTSYITMSFQ